MLLRVGACRMATTRRWRSMPHNRASCARRCAARASHRLACIAPLVKMTPPTGRLETRPPAGRSARHDRPTLGVLHRPFGPRARRAVKVLILGPGYVGSTMAACLVRSGHTVVGVDTNPARLATVAAGPPVREPGVEDLLAAPKPRACCRPPQTSRSACPTPTSPWSAWARRRVRTVSWRWVTWSQWPRSSALRSATGRTRRRRSGACFAAPCCPAPWKRW